MNVGPDHLSRIEISEDPTNIEEGFPDMKLFIVDMEDDHYAPIIHFLVTGVAQEEISTSQKKQLVVKASGYQLIVRHLYKLGSDEILRRCVLPHEQGQILEQEIARVTGGALQGSCNNKKGTSHRSLVAYHPQHCNRLCMKLRYMSTHWEAIATR